MREGKFNISAEQKEGKVIVHCYGHGGSGCTTSWGSVNKAIELFEEQFESNTDSPIHIIGGGIIGLTAAIELSHKGYEISCITADKIYEIPSWKNAGYFALVSVDTDPVEQANLDKIGMHTFLEYQKIAAGKHHYISPDCGRFLPVYSSIETDAGVEDLEKKGLIPPREYVSIDFGNGVVHHSFIKFMTYFMDTTRVMQQLHNEVKRLGIPIYVKKLASFEDLSENVIFNCAGLGAKELNNDDKVIAVRGHLANLNIEAGTKHMGYMIYTKIKDDNGEEGYVYMFPKCLQVSAEDPDGRNVFATLGGTFIPNTDLLSEDQLQELDDASFTKLLNRNSQFFWGKPFEK
jgi:hypothetical protein